MKFKIKILGKEFNVEIFENERGVKIKVNKEEFFFEEKPEIFKPRYGIPKKEFKEKEVLAPISGEILEIFVKEGDFVKEEQKLFLISAMKMENEILAEREGKVKKIFVKKGEKVEKGKVLLILE